MTNDEFRTFFIRHSDFVIYGDPATFVTNVRIGIQTRSLRQPLRQALVTAARLGADGVEIDARNEVVPAEMSATGMRQFRKLLDDLVFAESLRTHIPNSLWA